LLLNTEISFYDSSYRQQIAQKVFKDTSLLEKYEKLIHPCVLEAINNAYIDCQNASSFKMFVCEMPLLYELGLEGFFNKTIYVTAEDQICIDRFKAKTGYDKNQWLLRMNRFLNAKEAIKKSSFVINNNGKQEDLTLQINNFLTSLQIN
jgi:dephospho-CoA kinase